MSLSYVAVVLAVLLPVVLSTNIGQDGGYVVVVRFSQDLTEPPDCHLLFTNLELIFNTLSHSVFAVAGNRFFFREVNIVLPTLWKCKPTPFRAVSSAHFVVVPSGDEPFTRSGKICDKSGDFIVMSLPYLLNVVDDATYIWNLVIQWLKFAYLPVDDTTREMFCTDDGAAIYRKMFQHQDYLRSEEKEAIRPTRYKYMRPLLEARTESIEFSVSVTPSIGCVINSQLELDGWPVIGARLSATIRASNEQREILLTENGPGRYGAKIETNFGNGNYSVSVEATDSGSAYIIRHTPSARILVECCGWLFEPAEEEQHEPTGTFFLSHPQLWCSESPLPTPYPAIRSGVASSRLHFIHLLMSLWVYLTFFI